MATIVDCLTSFDAIQGQFDVLDLEGQGQIYIINCTATDTVEFYDISDAGLYLSLIGDNGAYSPNYTQYPASYFSYRCIASVVPEKIDKDRIVLPKGTKIEAIRMHFPLQHNLSIALSPFEDDEFFEPFEMYATGWQYPLTGELLSIARSVWACDFEGEVRQLWLQGKIREILALLMVRKTDLTLADRACAIVEQQPNIQWNIATLSRALATNDCYLKRAFKQQFNMGVASWIQSYRIHLAKQKLMSPKESITQIALDLGYQNSSYFAKVFKRSVGETPKAFRNRHFSR